MRLRQLLFSILCLLLPLTAAAQRVKIKVTYVDNKKDIVEKDDNFTEEAPLEATFQVDATDIGDHTTSYEWHIRKEGAEQDLLVRYEEETQYTFTESGSFVVTLKGRLTDIDQELDSAVVKITISESRLEMPNAFSPNGDLRNDIYGAKGINNPDSPDHWKSIIEFHAYIFNRWGQKLFEWTDITQGWDGTYNGSPVKEGVYFVLVKAKGADGREYNIKKDVNLLRGFTETTTTNGNTTE